MEQMLLPSFPLMRRKVLALLVVLIVVGIAPATAVLGFCAKMPCCFTEGEEAGLPLLGSNMADCCTTVNCYEAPSQELTVSAKAKLFVGMAVAVPPIPATLVAPPAVRHIFVGVSPPRRTSDRLASLSILLI